MISQLQLLGVLDFTPPVITSASSGSNPENSVLAFSLTANESVTWSITGGADSTLFEISGSTLRWLGNGTKDFESPNDSDTNNTYTVQVTATDLKGNTTNQTITITVTDVSEGPMNIISNGTFDDSSGWTLNGTVSAITSGALVFSGGAGSKAAFRATLIPLIDGHTYRFTYDCTLFTIGNVVCRVGSNTVNGQTGGSASSPTTPSLGSNTIDVTLGAKATDTVTISGTSGSTLTLDNLVILDIT